MRMVALAAILTAILSTTAWGEDAKPAGKAPPSDQEVAGAVGVRLAKVFVKFGVPNNIYPTNATSDDPKVCLDYDAFGFLVSKKTVQSCMFCPSWTGDACGVKLGDLAETVIKKLGKPDNVNNEDDGKQRLYWDYKVNDEVMRLQVNCDKNQKCTRVSLSLK